jgi:hypothetical protein
MKTAPGSGSAIERAARAAATRYVEEPAFRAAFDAARAELARQRLETVRLAAEGLGYALVPSDGAATLSGAPVSSVATAPQSGVTPKARTTKAKAKTTAAAKAKPVASGAASAKPSGAAKPKGRAAKGSAADAVVAFLADHAGARKGEIAEGTGLALGTLTHALRVLRDAKRIVKRGKTRAATYSVK